MYRNGQPLNIYHGLSTLRRATGDKVSNCFLSALGAAYGTAKSGVGISAMAVMKPDLIMKSIIPVVMAGRFNNSYLL